MTELLKLLMNDKGRDANRTIVLAVLSWVAFQVTEIKKDIAVVKAHVGIVQTNAATTHTNQLASLNPPKP